MIEVNEPRLLSVQVGRPRTMEWEGQTWTSDIYKAPVSERLFLDRTNLNGDKQANTRHHGGPDKAVCCFSIEHYPFWREELGRGEDFTFGAFGENFTLAGMTEERVCIGDVYADPLLGHSGQREVLAESAKGKILPAPQFFAP